MPLAYGYIRCSHDDSAESGLGLEAQVASIKAYFAYIQTRYEGLEWGGVIPDIVQSAFKKRLVNRPGGFKLDAVLKRGDHVLFARLDRGFRNTKDMLITKDDWEKRGISIHFVDQGLDIRKASGLYFATNLAAAAEWESGIKGERTRDALARVRHAGRAAGQIVKGYTIDENRYLVPDRKTQVLMRYVWMLHALWKNRKEKRMWFGKKCLLGRWWAISNRIEYVLAKREGRKMRPDGKRDGFNSISVGKIAKRRKFYDERAKIVKRAKEVNRVAKLRELML